MISAIFSSAFYYLPIILFLCSSGCGKREGTPVIATTGVRDFSEVQEIELQTLQDSSDDSSNLLSSLEKVAGSSNYAEIGPVSIVTLSESYSRIRKYYLKGSSSCYLLLASCQSPSSLIEMVLVDSDDYSVPDRKYEEEKDISENISGIISCPQKDGNYYIKARSKKGEIKCAFLLMGN